MKIAHKRPSNAIVVHYDQIDKIPMNVKPRIQVFCKNLMESGIQGQLWIYHNLDKDLEHLPDVIYPSIKEAANNATCKYLQMGIHYWVNQGKVYNLPGNKYE